MNDIVNGLFEIAGSFFILPSIVLATRAREVRGVSPVHIGFFTAWGLWNLWFYAAEGFWASWAGAGLLAAANAWYLVLVWRYR